MISDKDLEGIAEEMSRIAQEQSLDAKVAVPLFRTAAESYNQKQAAQVENLYAALRGDEWFMEAFQLAEKDNDMVSDEFATKHKATSKHAKDAFSVMYKQVYEYVNKLFNKKIHLDNKEYGSVFVVLERQADGKGRLRSYGTAHHDGSGRRNNHYFFVVADYDTLSAVVDSFANDPQNVRKFIGTVFDWDNSHDPRRSKQADVTKDMQKLYLHTEEKGVQTRVVERQE
jgi:hypothetical protein